MNFFCHPLTLVTFFPLLGVLVLLFVNAEQKNRSIELGRKLVEKEAKKYRVQWRKLVAENALDGVLTDLGAFARLGVEGIDLLLSDSTNAEQPGFVTSEREIAPVIDDVVRTSTGRSITFSVTTVTGVATSKTSRLVPVAVTVEAVPEEAAGDPEGAGTLAVRSVVGFMPSTLAAGRGPRIVLGARSVVNPGHPPG